MRNTHFRLLLLLFQNLLYDKLKIWCLHVCVVIVIKNGFLWLWYNTLNTLMLLSVRFGCYYKPHLWSRINIFTKISFLIVWQGSEYAYELPSQFTSFHVFFQSKTMPCYEKCFLFNKYPNFRCIIPWNSFLIPVLKCNQALLMHLNLV